jgi:ABC-type sugar transport system ATPase subunit
MEGIARSVIAKKVHETARQLHIDELLERRPRDLSGGQRQRVAIGRAMIRKPQFFLFDEPLSNLDAELRVRMRLEIARLQQELQTTMVFVTHDQVEAMTLAHTIVVMRDGTIQQIGSPLAVYRNPNNRFVASFIGSPSMNFFDVTSTEAHARSTRLTLPGGQALTVPRVAAAEPITVGIRPEHVEFDPDLPDNRIGDVAGQYQVLGIEQLGDRSYAHLGLSVGELTVLTPVEHRFGSGEPLVVRFPPDRIHLFAAGGRAV